MGSGAMPPVDQVREAVLRSAGPLTSSEIAARVRRGRTEVEAALELAQRDPAIVVRDWPMEDPHFGVDRIVVACRAEPAGDPGAVLAAETACQRAYESILRDFLASHRCV